MSETTNQEQLILDGSWERSGRSPVTAAVIALLGIGAVYFNAQSILVAIAMILKGITSGFPATEGSYLDRLAETMKYSSGPIRITLLISEYTFMLLPALFLVRRWHSSNVPSYIRLKNLSFVEILLAVLATIAVIPASNAIADYLVRQLHVPERLMEINAEIFTARSGGELVWLTVVVCVTPAICEEIFFRGYVQRTFERSLGWKSFLLVGILFGLFHLQPLGLITLSILGILFGYFYYRSGSLFPSMAAHFTNNFVAIVMSYRPTGTGAPLAHSVGLLGFWMTAGLLLAAAGILALFHVVTRGERPA